MKSFPKRTILVLGFGLALGIQLMIGALSYRNTTRLIAASDQVRHSQEVLHRLEDVLGDLTGDIAETHRKMENLRKLTADNPEQQRAEQVSDGQTETLVKTLNALAAEPTLDIFSKQVLMAIAEQLGAHSASLWFCDRSRHVLWAHVLYERERFKPAAEFPQLKREYTVEEFLGWEEFVRGQRPVVVQDVETNGIIAPIRDCLVGLDVKTMLCVPLRTADDIIGCIALSNTQRRDYQPQELELVQALARQLSLAIQLTRLAEQGKQSAVLEERNRMARDIHDTLAQGFTGIIVQLEAAEDIFRENADGASAHILRAKSLARESLAEARRSVRALRPRGLEASDLAGELGQL